MIFWLMNSYTWLQFYLRSILRILVELCEYLTSRARIEIYTVFQNSTLKLGAVIAGIKTMKKKYHKIWAREILTYTHTGYFVLTEIVLIVLN